MEYNKGDCEHNNSQEETYDRPLAYFSPCIWGDLFTSFSLDQSAFDAIAKEVEVLKEIVRGMLIDSSSIWIDKINLINSLHRLGISYHFEKEIDSELEIYFGNLKCENNDIDDLYTVSVQFRVLRQHGYDISCDIFNKFKDEAGNFKESLASDVKGMLSLYEASHTRLQGEDILEDALAFTRGHLVNMEAAHTTSLLLQQVNRAMEQPFHKGIPRSESRFYISIYEQDESRDEEVLRLAKLDFNLVQLMYRHELSLLSKWWEDLDFPSNFPYVRQRLVETYLFGVGFHFEPHYSLARIIFTKVLVMITIIDDTYDSYGTLDELDLFTEAIGRWDADSVDQLPKYMKFLYRTLLNLFNEFDEQMTKEGRSYGIYYSKEAMKELCRHYNQEAKWFINKYVPSFDEYIKVAYTSSTLQSLVTSSYMGMGDTATKNTFEWLKGCPRIFKAAQLIGRLQNDIVSSEFEKKRGHVASGVDCYIKQYSVSKQEAINELNMMITNAWKDVNKECLKPTMVPLQLIAPIVNFSRIMDVIYKHDDGFTHPEKIKSYVTSLFIDPVPL